MTIQVRFAPSPTGWLHIGNLRAALLNFLYARRHEGRFWLRMDDTDNERSKPEYAAGIEQALGWTGITWDRFARQSDRLEEYKVAAETLKASGRLYPAYETAEELALKRKSRLAQGLPPIYDRAALTLSDADRARFEAEGRTPHWRFKLVPGTIEWPDIIHGMMKFDAATMSDPVLIREDGSPLFILSGVVDDAEFGITHIIRGDDHITNTAVQIQIFEALGAAIPVFAHFSHLIDADGSKFSKRSGALGISELEEQGFEPMAVVSLLARLGTSDPIEPRNNLQDVIDGFELTHFSRTAARLDMEDLARINAKILHEMPFVAAQPRLTARGLATMQESFWTAVQGNLTKFSDIDIWWQVAEGPVNSVIEDAEFIAIAAELAPDGEWNEQTWSIWTNALKERTGQTGKLLFMPLRLALTGQEHGPEMRVLLPLIGRERALARLNSQNEQRSIVLSIIDHAFDKTIPPSVDTILVDGYFVEPMRKVLTGAPWQDLTPEDAAKCRDTGYLTPQGFLYYLPAFLRLIAENPETADIMGEQVLWSLAPSNLEFCQEMYEFFQSQLSEEQRRAIKEFFLYMWNYERRWLDPDTNIKAVIDTYWGESKASNHDS